MSPGPKKTFGVSLGYFWYAKSLDWPIFTIGRKMCTSKKKFVCFQAILGAFLSFLTIWTVFAANISTTCSGLLLWHLRSISESFDQFKHSLLPFCQNNFSHFPIWNLPKCTIDSWDGNTKCTCILTKIFQTFFFCSFFKTKLKIQNFLNLSRQS